MKISELVSQTDVMELMLDAVCVVDRQGHFLYVSPAFESIFGYSPEAIIGKPMLDFVFKDDRDSTLRTVDTLLAGVPKPGFENRWVHKDGRVVNVLWSARWSEQHQVRIAVAHDITERKKMEERLQYMAGHDPLTDLPNRVLLLDRLHTALMQARREATRLALLFIDIDGFKFVNDNYGHPVGDVILREIAQRLRKSVRESDTVGRLGGDEFLLLLGGNSKPEDVARIAEKIRGELALPFEASDIKFQLTPSIGVAQYPENGDADQQLIQCADQAMYRAKNNGGNQVVFF